MRRRRLYWLGVAAVFFATALALCIFLMTGGGPSDQIRLQGTWVSDDDRVTLTFYHDLAVLDGFPEPRRAYFRLDPKASPKRITECDADGPGISPPLRILGVTFGSPFVDSPNLEVRGIYELEGDRLRLCFATQGQDFPKSFNKEIGVLEYHRP